MWKNIVNIFNYGNDLKKPTKIDHIKFSGIMDRVSSTSVVAPSSSSAIQLRRLCKHILGTSVQVRVQFLTNYEEHPSSP
jgi:hypothetical protein